MMDPTISQSQIVIPSRHSLCSSLLAGNMHCSSSISSGRQRNMTRRMSWAKQGQGTLHFSSLQQSRCRTASLPFKRHLENRDQEPSSKHFLSEDKMAARFNNLSLDNDHIYSSNGFPIHNKDPKWQQAYTQLKELQQRLCQDETNEEASSTEDDVIVDGEFIMPDCPMLPNLSLLQQPFGNQVSLLPEEVFLTLNPCTEVVLWSPPGNSGLQSIRTLMSMPSSLSSSAQDQQDMVAMQEEMEV